MEALIFKSLQALVIKLSYLSLCVFVRTYVTVGRGLFAVELSAESYRKYGRFLIVPLKIWQMFKKIIHG